MCGQWKIIVVVASLATTACSQPAPQNNAGTEAASEKAALSDELTPGVAKSLILSDIKKSFPCERVPLYQPTVSYSSAQPPDPYSSEYAEVRALAQSLANDKFRIESDRVITNEWGKGTHQVVVIPRDQDRNRNDAISIENSDSGWSQYTPSVYTCRAMIKDLSILDITADPANPKRADVVYRASLEIPSTALKAMEYLQRLHYGVGVTLTNSTIDGTAHLQRLDATGWRIALSN